MPPPSRFYLPARHNSEGGVILSGAGAFSAMWRAVSLLRPLGLAARWPRVLALLERGYARLLRALPRLQWIAALESA
jgi:threonine synthase